MITAIEIENFKAFGERQRIELRPITLLFGPNSGGKSSVGHAIHYLREIICEGNADAHRTWSGGDVLDLGGIRNVAHRHRLSVPIILKAEFKVNVEDLPHFDVINDILNDEGESDDELLQIESVITSASVELEIDPSRSSCVRRYTVGVNGHHVGSIYFDPMKPYADIRDFNSNHPLFARDTPFDMAGVHARGMDFLAPTDTELEHLSPEDQEGVENVIERLLTSLGIRRGASDWLAIQRPSGILPNFGSMLHIHVIESGIPRGTDRQAYRLLCSILSLMLLGPGHALAKHLEALRYVGPLRAMPDRDIREGSNTGSSRWPNGLAAWEFLLAESMQSETTSIARETSVTKEVSRWLSDANRLNTGYNLEIDTRCQVPAVLVEALKQQDGNGELSELVRELIHAPTRSQVALRDLRRNVLLQPRDVGVGLSQVVPVLVALCAPQSSLVMLEQPELHLHPRQQTALADALIHGCRLGDNRIVIAETHSEHLILRLLRRIRETNEGTSASHSSLLPSEVGVVYVSPSDNGSSITTISVTVDGDFSTRWPDGFFHERTEELM